VSVREDAENTVIYLAVAGLLAGVVGGVLAATQWQVDEFGDHRNAFLAYLGLTVSALGQLALFIAVVAYATRLGVRWSGLLDRDESVPPAPRSYLDADGL
jgi:hypothetical protein